MFKRSFYLSCIYAICSLIPANINAEKPQFFDNNEQNEEPAAVEAPASIDIKTLQHMQMEMFEAQIAELRNQIQNIIFCIQQVEQTIAAKKIQISKQDAQAALQNLQFIRQLLQGMAEKSYKVAHPMAIAENSYMIGYITLSLKQSLSDIKTISVQKFVESLQIAQKKIIKMDFSGAEGYKQVEERIVKNKKFIKQLIKQAETLGLTKTNLLWRKIEKSKWTAKAKTFAKYSALITIATTAALLLLHPETGITILGHELDADGKRKTWLPKFIRTRVKNIWRPFGLGQDLNSHPVWQAKIASDKRTHLEEANSHFSNGNPLQGQIAQNKALHPDEISFPNGLTLAISNIASIPGILLMLCSPLSSYAKGLWNKAFGTLDTGQDYSEVSKWASKKIENALAYLRGETTYQYIGAEFNEGDTEERVTLDDIIGQEYLKEIALELADFIKNPERYERAHIKAEAGILLYGPPQTGKTMFAKALQTLLKDEVAGDRVAFIPVTNKDLEQFSVEEMFYLAGKNAPCVLFIDEIEMIGAKRDGAGGQRTRELLTCINGLSSQNISKNVFVIGATNKPEDLDFALTVKGRFGIQIPLTYPIYKNRLEYIKRQFKTRGVNHLSEEFIEQMAEETEGNSFNDLLSIINDAFARSMRDLRAVTKEDFENAFDKQIRNILPLSTLTDKEKNIIATYQVGLGLARHLLQTGIKATCLTINPVKQKIRYNDSAFSFKDSSSDKDQNDKLLPVKNRNLTVNGYTFTTGSQHVSTFSSDADAKNEILVLLAGQAALKVLLGESFSSYMPEHKAECLNKIKAFLSNGEKNTDDIIKEALALKSAYEQEIYKLLAPHKEAIEKLAQELVSKKIIRTNEWQQLLRETV